MSNLTGCNGRWLKRFTAAGWMPLLLLVALPGCAGRERADWSRVQAVTPDTKTELQLYEGVAPHEERKVKGRFVSATVDSVTLELKDGRARTVQKDDIRKILRRRPFMERWPGWAALGVTVFALAVMPMDSGDPRLVSYPLFHAYYTLPITTAFFIGSRNKGIYEVKPKKGNGGWHPKEDGKDQSP